jgi:hypothetical protein
VIVRAPNFPNALQVSILRFPPILEGNGQVGASGCNVDRSDQRAEMFLASKLDYLMGLVTYSKGLFYVMKLKVAKDWMSDGSFMSLLRWQSCGS